MQKLSFLLLVVGVGAIAACGGDGNGGNDMGNDMAPTCSVTGPIATAPAGTCILDYAIAVDSAQLDIRNTFLGLGDGTHDIGPGRLVILTASNGSAPIDGAAAILFYSMTQNFGQTIGTTTIDTVTAARAGCPDDTTGLNAGTLTGSAIAWDACPKVRGAGGPGDATYWTPAEATETGDGCLGPYNSTGNVHCEGSLCAAGNLMEGDNPTNGTYYEPVEALTFAVDWSTVTMDYMELPDPYASTTWVRFNGTLTTMDCN